MLMYAPPRNPMLADTDRCNLLRVFRLAQIISPHNSNVTACGEGSRHAILQRLSSRQYPGVAQAPSSGTLPGPSRVAGRLRYLMDSHYGKGISISSLHLLERFLDPR